MPPLWFAGLVVGFAGDVLVPSYWPVRARCPHISE